MSEHVIWSNINTIGTDIVWLGDEKSNLSGCFADQPIVCIGDLGLWDGRKSAYKVLTSKCLSDVLTMDGDWQNWYVDALGDLRSTSIHHDGRNYYLYRELRPELSATQKYNFFQRLVDGTADRACICRYTKSLGWRVAEVYGWKVKV